MRGDALFDWDYIAYEGTINKKIEAQAIARGDVFIFRGKMYVCLCNIVDKRTTVSAIVAIPRTRAFAPLSKITVLRLFRTFHVEVINNLPFVLEAFENTKEEISDAELKEMARLKKLSAQSVKEMENG